MEFINVTRGLYTGYTLFAWELECRSDWECWPMVFGCVRQRSTGIVTNRGIDDSQNLEITKGDPMVTFAV